MSWFLYIVECSDKSLYTGITKDIEKRVKRHNAGNGAKSLRGKRPVVLVYSETLEGYLTAARREREIKQWSRKRKLDLISNAGG